MLAILLKLLKALNSEAAPWQIGWAMALGLLAGLLPFGLLTLVVLFVACVIAINLLTFFLVWGAGSALMLMLGDQLESVVWAYAQAPFVLDLLSGSEALQVLRLHHTQVLGALALGLLLMLPVAWAGSCCVHCYRKYGKEKVMKFRLVQTLKASKLAQLYQQLS